MDRTESPLQAGLGRPREADHPALLYEGQEDFLRFMAPYVRGGLEEGATVFVAARGDHLPALRAEIGDPGPEAQLVSTETWHPHPSRRLRAFHELVTGRLATGTRRLRLAGEPVWPDGPAELVREWQRYESVLNRVLAPYPLTLTCLYDASRLDASIVSTARRTHPALHEGSAHRRSDSFEEPEEFLTRRSPDLPPPPSHAVRVPGVGDLHAARVFLHHQALRSGVEPRRAENLVAAAHELLTNAFKHAGGVTAVRAWTENGRFLCQVDDGGTGIDDPLAGYRPPPTDTRGGRGLWLARQLVDLLQIVAGPGGTSVRLQVAR